MSNYFFSIEMLVEAASLWCDDEPYCGTCEAVKQNLYNLSREENR